MLPGLGFGTAYEGMFASEMAKEQLQADAQQRKFERRVSLGREAEVSLFTLSLISTLAKSDDMPLHLVC